MKQLRDELGRGRSEPSERDIRAVEQKRDGMQRSLARIRAFEETGAR